MREMVRGRERRVVKRQLEITASKGVPVGQLKRKARPELWERPIGLAEGIQCAAPVTRKEDIGDILKKKLGEAGLGGEARSCMNKPTGAIPRMIIARGEVIVIQDRYAGREVDVRSKNRRKRIAEVEDTEILAHMDIAARDVIGKEGTICLQLGWRRDD